VRLAPVGNNFITTCLAAVSAVSVGSFFLASLIGLAPQTVIFALLGSGLAKAQHHQTAVSLALLVATAVAFFIFYRRSRLAAAVAHDLADGSVSDPPSTKSDRESFQPQMDTDEHR